MFRRGFVALLVFFTASLGPSCCADLIYTTTPFELATPDWSYTGGTITTEGTFTTLTSGNVDTPATSIIKDWDLAFSSPSNSYTLNNTNSTISYQDASGGVNFETTAMAILSPNSPVSTVGQDRLVFVMNDGSAMLQFLGQSASLDNALHLTDFVGSGAVGVSNAMVGSGVGSTIAAVPEPGPLLGLGLIGLGWGGWKNLRRNRHAS